MGIKSYKATKDNTITNGFKLTSATRGTGSNMGASDILEVYSIYGQQTTSSVELSRVLIQFPINEVSSDRNTGNIPAKGNVNFYLRMFNARHSEQLPRDFTVNVLAVSQSWQEGYGLDMDGYSDETEDSIEGSNWMNANNTFTAANAQLWLKANTGTGSLVGQTLGLTDASGISQTFTFTDDLVRTGGSIGVSGSSNTTETIGTIKTAINNISALGITAGTIVSQDTNNNQWLTLTQDSTGYAGNTAIISSLESKFSGSDAAYDGALPAGFLNGSGRWATVGGDYHTSAYTPSLTMPNYTFKFEDGDEDLLVDVTDAVEEWVASTQANNGFGIFLTSSQEAYVDNVLGADSSDGDGSSVLVNTEGQKKSFYTKRFFSRTSEFFFKRPALEARWDSRIMDDRGNFYSSASIATAADNLNKLYLYNYIRGTLKDIPHDETLSVKLYASSDNTPIGQVLASATAGKYKTGIYSASISLNTTSSVIHDVWSGTVGGEYKTGSIKVKSLTDSCVLLANDYNQFTTKITNLKSNYGKDEIARFRVFSRPRNYSPTIYSVASKDIENVVFTSASFEVYRVIDNETVITNSTGSATRHTYLSYDESGSYFDLNMSLLEPDYMYGIRFLFHASDGWREQPEKFNFRVEKR